MVTLQYQMREFNFKDEKEFLEDQNRRLHLQRPGTTAKAKRRRNQQEHQLCKAAGPTGASRALYKRTGRWNCWLCASGKFASKKKEGNKAQAGSDDSDDSDSTDVDESPEVKIKKTPFYCCKCQVAFHPGCYYQIMEHGMDGVISVVANNSGKRNGKGVKNYMERYNVRVFLCLFCYLEIMSLLLREFCVCSLNIPEKQKRITEARKLPV